MSETVQCDHPGARCRRTWDTNAYCPVCWTVQLWYEWMQVVSEYDGD